MEELHHGTYVTDLWPTKKEYKIKIYSLLPLSQPIVTAE